MKIIIVKNINITDPLTFIIIEKLIISCDSIKFGGGNKLCGKSCDTNHLHIQVILMICTTYVYVLSLSLNKTEQCIFSSITHFTTKLIIINAESSVLVVCRCLSSIEINLNDEWNNRGVEIGV